MVNRGLNRDSVTGALVEKNNIFLRFCLCIFENDTVKSDCPMQESYEIFKDLIQTVGSLY